MERNHPRIRPRTPALRAGASVRECNVWRCIRLFVVHSWMVFGRDKGQRAWELQSASEEELSVPKVCGMSSIKLVRL
jgi:hypothetical protein